MLNSYISPGDKGSRDSSIKKHRDELNMVILLKMLKVRDENRNTNLIHTGNNFENWEVLKIIQGF